MELPALERELALNLRSMPGENDKLNRETLGRQFNLKSDGAVGLDPGQHQGHLLLHLQGPQLDGVGLPLQLHLQHIQ